MTTLSYEWVGTDGEKKVFKTYPEAVEWKQAHGGEFKMLTDYTPSQSVEHCIEGAAYASARWHNYKY